MSFPRVEARYASLWASLDLRARLRAGAKSAGHDAYAHVAAGEGSLYDRPVPATD
jgi:hypothetical protein